MTASVIGKSRSGLTVAAAVLLAACQSTPQQQVASLSGPELYQKLCSSCHGVDAKGHGPVASLIKTGVPDLTLIAHRDGGEFPIEDVRRTIDGRWDRRAHGARDMPVWGAVFKRSSGGNVSARIDAIVRFLEALQQRPA